MKVLIGLGNPGEKYKNTRHNVGFMFLDYLSRSSGKENKKEWQKDKFSKSYIFELNLGGEDYILVKPQTFMNNSGYTANKILNNKKVFVEDLMVIHDDLDIEIGSFKIQKGKGPKVHNGLSSIESSLRFKDFVRIRIGIDNKNRQGKTGEEYVLSNFKPEEKQKIEQVFKKIIDYTSGVRTPDV